MSYSYSNSATIQIGRSSNVSYDYREIEVPDYTEIYNRSNNQFQPRSSSPYNGQCAFFGLIKETPANSGYMSLQVCGVVPNSTGTLNFACYASKTESFYNRAGNVTSTRTTQRAVNITPVEYDFSSPTTDIYGDVYASWSKNAINNGERDDFLKSIKTSFPVFYDTDRYAIEMYVKMGDDSGAIPQELPPIDYTIYIDGTKNPTYYIRYAFRENADDILKSSPYLNIGYASTSWGWDLYIDQIELKQSFNVNQQYYTTTFDEISGIVDDTWIPDIIEDMLPPGDVALVLRVCSSGTAFTSSMFVELKYKADDSEDPLSSVVAYGYCIDTTTRIFIGEITDGYTRTSDGSTITILAGEPPEDFFNDDDYDGGDDGVGDDNGIKDEDLSNDPVSCGIGVLTGTFKLSENRLKQLGHFLWTGHLYQDFDLINTNPIENIITIKSIPIDITAGADRIINIANVDTGVNGKPVEANFPALDIGSVAISKKYNSFLDYSPYTQITVYLPYIGFKEINASDVMGKTLKVRYLVDIITGGCMAQLLINNTKAYEFAGSIGVDIPITASNRAQVEAAYLETAATSIVSVGTTLGATAIMNGIQKQPLWNSPGEARMKSQGLLSGGKAFTNILDSAMAQYHYSTQGSPNPSCIAAANRTCYVLINRPTADNISGYGHSIGYKCNLTKTLKNLKGLTITTDNVELSGITCTQAEKEELRALLSSGVFL